MEATVQERLTRRRQQITAMRQRHRKELYQELAEAKQRGIKVAWMPAGKAPELFDALGIIPCAPENLSTVCASRQIAQRFCDAADIRGIAPDVCSYGRIIMGMMWENDGPYGPLPQPDIVILDTAGCDAHAKMWEIPGQHYGVPGFRLDGVFHMDGHVTGRSLDYRISQLRALVDFCEAHLGVKFDYDRFKENMRIAGQVRGLLDEVQHLRKARPCPRSTHDLAADIFYLFTMAHSPKALDYFELVVEDCRDRVAHKIGLVEEERFRLFYDNIPLWFWLEFYEHLERRGAVVVSDSYTTIGNNCFYATGGRFDPERPFESLALRQLHSQVCFGTDANLDRYEHMIEEWECDGFILFVNRSCKAASAAALDKAAMIKRRFAIPILEFEGEMANPQSIDRVEVLGRANFFVDMLERAALEKAGRSWRGG